MIPGMPALGIRFDIGKIDSGGYGLECWKIFWRSVGIQGLGAFLLFEGDTAATPGSEDVFCIAIQSSSATALQKIRVALERSDEFRKVAASPEFVEGDSVVAEPLPDAGRIDAAGNFLLGAWWPQAGFDAVRKEKGGSSQEDHTPTAVSETTRVDPPHKSRKKWWQVWK